MIGFVAIDLSQEWMDVELAVGMEKAVQLKRVPRTRGTCQDIFRHAKRLGITELHVVMEATGALWKDIAKCFFEKQARVYVVNPARIKAQRKVSGKRSKTDRIDTSVIMKFIRANLHELHSWAPPSSAVETLQDLVRYRELQVSHRTALKNVRKSKNLPDVVRRAIDKDIKDLDEKIDSAEEEIAATIQADATLMRQAGQADTVPGIGEVNSAIIVAECRAFAEIREPRQATAFAGLDVVHHESGKFAGKSRISKQGSRLLRRAMVNAAASAIQRKGVFRDFYLRLRQRKLKKKQALIAAARKLLEVTVAVILSDKPFDKGRNVAA